jgi:hypothetical protein
MGGEEKFADLLLERYPARIANARDFALTNRVLLLKNPQGIGIDIAFASRPRDWEDVQGVCSRITGVSWRMSSSGMLWSLELGAWSAES